MKLYYSPGACSMSVDIALREASLPFEAIKVDLATHKLENGDDYYAISPRGYVPLLELDDGSRHTEASALLQYVADLDTSHRLIPAFGTTERLRVIEWLSFISTELHKTFGPLWKKDTEESVKRSIHEKLATRFKELDRHLSNNDFLAGPFTVADAYAFTILNWSNFLQMDLAPYPAIKSYLSRVAARPKVHEAMKAEGLIRE